MKAEALLVEDDPRIAEGIADILLSLGHEHDWVRSQLEARRRLQKKDYAYILLDLKIPAKPGRGGDSIEFGVNLLDDIQRLKGEGGVPVVLMTAHGSEGLNLATHLRSKGVTDFISKPFPQTGRTLASVIREVLARRGIAPEAREGRKGPAAPVEPQPFSGGEMVIYPGFVTLCGVKIISDKGTRQSMMILRELRKTGAAGRRVELWAEELMKAIDATDIQVITGCIKTLRRNIAQRLRKHRNLVVGDQDVVAHSEQGYRLHERVTVRDATPGEMERPGHSGRLDVAPLEAATPPAREGRLTEPGVAVLNERQEWALNEAAHGRQVSLLDLQRKFRVSEKTARRDLGVLVKTGKTAAQAGPEPGDCNRP